MNKKQEDFIKNTNIINEMLSNNRPISEIARLCNLKYETCKRYLIKFGFNFKTNQNRKGINHKELYKSAMYYINNNITINASKLRNKLLKDGIKEAKCECCGLTK